MADAVVDKVIVELTARLGQYNADVRSSKALFDRSVGGMAATAENTERRIRASSAGIKTALLSATSALAVGFSAKTVTDLADSYTRFTNQLKLAGLEGTNLSGVQEKLFQSAQRYGVELEGLGTLYGRVAQAGKELGATQEDLLKFTNGVAAAIKVQGSTTEASKGALLQLSQALGGTIVRAEEYNSINEGARPILQAVADGSDRFKGSVNALRTAVIDGKVSSQEFYQAFLKGSSELEAKAGKANLTIAASLTTLNNALGVYVGQTDASLSATQRISAAIESLANNLDTIIPAITVLVGLVGVRYVGSLVAATVATVGKARADLLAVQNAAAYTVAVNAQAAANARLALLSAPATAALNYQAATSLTAATAARGLGSGLLALAGGPIGVTVLAVAALAAGMIYLNSKYSEAAILQRDLAASATATGSALDEYEKAARAAANATAENASQAIANANAMRLEAQEAVRSAIALRERTAALAVQRRAEAQEADRQASRGGVATPYPGLQAGRSIQANRRRDDADAAELRAVAQEEAALKRLFEIQQGLSDGSYKNAPVVAAVATKKGPKGKSAEEIENERLRIERRFADDLRDANRELIDARAARAKNETDILANDIRQIRQNRDDSISEAEERGPNGSKEYTQARVDQLTAVYRATAAIDEQTAIQNSANRLFAASVQVQEARFENQSDALSAERDLARTSASRAELDRQLLALSQAQERAQLAAIVASEESSEAERQIARERLAFLPRLQAAQDEALRRQNLTALERMGTTERSAATADPQQRREIVEGIAADELDGLASALAKASLEAEGFGEALLDTGKSIVESALAEVYQSIIVAPLADLMRQGLDSIFGTAATNLKTSAETQGAVAATALSTASGTAAASMGAVTVAANILQAALLQAATAAGAEGGSNILSTIGSSLGGSSGGARAIGGNVSQNLPVLVGENRPEIFWPSGSGVISPYMPQAEARDRRGGGSGNVQIVNNTGVPAVPIIERDEESGSMKISLEPLGNQMVEGAGRSGKLKKALMKSPQPRKRA